MKSRTDRPGSGFSLVEVVVATGITSFCLAALLGLFALGLSTARDSSEELQAANLAQSMLATRRAVPSAELLDFPLPPLSGPAAGTAYVDANGVVAPQQSARFGVTYEISGRGQNAAGIFVHLSLFWPAQSSRDRAAGHYEIATVVLTP